MTPRHDAEIPRHLGPYSLLDVLGTGLGCPQDAYVAHRYVRPDLTEAFRILLAGS